MSGYIRYSFAIDGERVPIDESTQPSGVISLQSGYPSGYSLPQANPLSKNIERTKFNELMYLVTTAIRILQQQGAPDFIEASENGGVAYSYAKYARCFRSGVCYESLIDANTDVPPSSNWKIIDDLATETVRGLVEKATQFELNSGAANKYPDSQTIRNGFNEDDFYFQLPDFLGGWRLHWGVTILGDIASLTSHTTNFTGFSVVSAVLTGSVNTGTLGAFVVHLKGFNASSVTVGFDEWASQVQTGAGYWWLAIGK